MDKVSNRPVLTFSIASSPIIHRTKALVYMTILTAKLLATHPALTDFKKRRKLHLCTKNFENNLSFPGALSAILQWILFLVLIIWCMRFVEFFCFCSFHFLINYSNFFFCHLFCIFLVLFWSCLSICSMSFLCVMTAGCFLFCSPCSLTFVCF